MNHAVSRRRLNLGTHVYVEQTGSVKGFFLSPYVGFSRGIIILLVLRIYSLSNQ
jgi:hypothetical protein